MDNLNLISNFAEFKELKNIDKSTMIGVLEMLLPLVRLMSIALWLLL